MSTLVNSDHLAFNYAEVKPLPVPNRQFISIMLPIFAITNKAVSNGWIPSFEMLALDAITLVISKNNTLSVTEIDTYLREILLSTDPIIWGETFTKQGFLMRYRPRTSPEAASLQVSWCQGKKFTGPYLTIPEIEAMK